MTERLDFNTALETVGSFGPYQQLLCALLVVPSAAFSALTYFTQFFIIMVPDHWCRFNEPVDYNGTIRNLKDLLLPLEKNGQDLTYSKCMIYDGNLTDTLFWNSSDPKTVTCDRGWQYDFSSLYPTIATELNWVCDDNQLPYWSQTIFYIGTSLGTFVFGHVADRFGRKPSILLSYLIACCAGIASSFATSFAVFSALRFFVGACIIPLSEDPYVLSLEYIGVKRRTLPIVFWSLGYVLFSAMCPWIAYGLRNWQLLCIITATPLFFMVLGAKFIPESASWLMTRGRHGDMLFELKRVARINGKEFPIYMQSSIVDDNNTENEDSEKKLTLVDLVRTPRLRKHTLILAASWFITYCCYHTNTQNTSNLSADIYESFTYGALVEAPVMVFILFGLDRFGRRWPMVAALTLAGIAGILSVVLKDIPQTFLGIGLLQRLGITANYNIIMQYSAEVYPTALRGRGLAFLRLMGTLGLYLSPSLVYLALKNQALPLLVSGVLAAALAIITIFLPETLHRHLPHTVGEAENFGKDQKIFSCPGS